MFRVSTLTLMIGLCCLTVLFIGYGDALGAMAPRLGWGVNYLASSSCLVLPFLVILAILTCDRRT